MAIVKKFILRMISDVMVAIIKSSTWWHIKCRQVSQKKFITSVLIYDLAKKSSTYLSKKKKSHQRILKKNHQRCDQCNSGNKEARGDTDKDRKSAKTNFKTKS